MFEEKIIGIFGGGNCIIPEFLAGVKSFFFDVILSTPAKRSHLRFHGTVNEDQQYNLHEPDQPITDQNFRGLPASILVI